MCFRVLELFHSATTHLRHWREETSTDLSPLFCQPLYRSKQERASEVVGYPILTHSASFPRTNSLDIKQVRKMAAIANQQLPPVALVVGDANATQVAQVLAAAELSQSLKAGAGIPVVDVRTIAQREALRAALVDAGVDANLPTPSPLLLVQVNDRVKGSGLLPVKDSLCPKNETAERLRHPKAAMLPTGTDALGELVAVSNGKAKKGVPARPSNLWRAVHGVGAIVTYLCGEPEDASAAAVASSLFEFDATMLATGTLSEAGQLKDQVALAERALKNGGGGKDGTPLLLKAAARILAIAVQSLLSGGDSMRFSGWKAAAVAQEAFPAAVAKTRCSLSAGSSGIADVVSRVSGMEKEGLAKTFARASNLVAALGETLPQGRLTIQQELEKAFTSGMHKAVPASAREGMKASVLSASTGKGGQSKGNGKKKKKKKGGKGDGGGGDAAQLDRGDYQFNSVMTMFKTLKDESGFSGPASFGDAIVGGSGKEGEGSPLPAEARPGGENGALLDKITMMARPPHFVNLHLSREMVARGLLDVLRNGPRPPVQRRRRCTVDFSSPNIAKEMHVGHLRSTIIGESVCRVLEFCGHEVLRV